MNVSMSLKRKTEKVIRLLDELAQLSADGALIVVEGPNDVVALRRLGVLGEVIPAKAMGKTFIDLVSELELQEREVILLMDFDRRGREWTKRLAAYLERGRVRVNLHVWRGLQELVGREVKDVEGLTTYLETVRRKMGEHILGEWTL